MKGRLVIGLTGNIATGKSEVLRILAGLGAYVIDADAVAHQVMRSGGPAFEAVVHAFGTAIVAATHDLRFAGDVAERVVRLVDGRIAGPGATFPPQEAAVDAA